MAKDGVFVVFSSYGADVVSLYPDPDEKILSVREQNSADCEVVLSTRRRGLKNSNGRKCNSLSIRWTFSDHNNESCGIQNRC